MEKNTKLDLQLSQTKNYVRVSVIPPDDLERHPCNIVCLVDGSLSMGSKLVIHQKNGGKKESDMTTLDLVKHTVKTIASSLNPQDRLALVGFSTHSKIYFELTEMDDQGKNVAFTEIDKMWAGGQTNIWGGLQDSLEVIKKGFRPNQNVCIFLFTDGRPTMIPAIGHVEMLRRWKEQHPAIQFSIFTFGFGNDLDTDLMLELSQEQNGIFSFISDSSMLGTVFSNALANILSTMANNVHLNLQLSEGYTFDGEGVMQSQSFQAKKTNKNTTLDLNLGLIRYGQTKDLILKILPQQNRKLSDVKITYTLKYKLFVGDNPQDIETVSQKDVQVVQNAMIDDECHYVRFLFIEKIKQSILRMNTGFQDRAIKNIDDLQVEIQNKAKENDAIVAFLECILQDLQGEVKLAFSNQDHFKNWGVNYLPSLCQAHFLQQCSNFKDKSLQNYGSILFKKIREITDKIFCGNKFKSQFINDDRQLYAKFYDLVNLNDFYDVSGGCIHGKCKVLLENNQYKNVEEIRKGDIVICPRIGNKAVKVVCVVKTLCTGSNHSFVKLGNLLITPWHPVRLMHEQQWQFPSSLGQTIFEQADAVYSFLLEDGHSMSIEGVECIALAHNISEPVAQHAYYGTHKIVDDLSNLQGFREGYVIVNQQQTKRDKLTHEVIGIQQNLEIKL
ncbi:von willebrand factor type A (vWA) domain was originally protein (macronuclear) [Tetrahymena thermophila SB210]|uniref:von willebrand factor type A (VWA) domain was originally protein n=1 Tax=Tetrahymena thermophila (strain SB210) TaxID=312017 RepID=Q22N58_TETTS|nr:von willebrand factor type A (vWA) domain was originally protein [Tetrahymena thermophila SB210]EAR86927.1 von willebrand factor type A (vWA) domain was originally protein [Tetrahymena thermophila SB210]|eukprot:XP_001007172.1 von willebrand factor type A (vWA) domain was originally protein [Tetrahymena thermophila SB210]